MDQLKTKSGLEKQFEELSHSWPLGCGQLIRVNMSQTFDVHQILHQVQKIWLIG
jgi:hypothetical protein